MAVEPAAVLNCAAIPRDLIASELFGHEKGAFTGATAAISAGSFRSDLFYRLHVFPIEIPSLRERSEGIPLLVEYFIDRYARGAGKHFERIEKRTLQVLRSYPWPGNIRELQNVIERSAILCESDIFSIDESWLPLPLPATESKHHMELPRRLEAQKKKLIEGL